MIYQVIAMYQCVYYLNQMMSHIIPMVMMVIIKRHMVNKSMNLIPLLRH